jgi:hypothetical protein
MMVIQQSWQKGRIKRLRENCKRDSDSGSPSEFEGYSEGKIRERARDPEGCERVDDESGFTRAMKGGKRWQINRVHIARALFIAQEG